jgi:hypothetical protein
MEGMEPLAVVDPDEVGLRIQSQSGAPASATTPSYYNDTRHAEQDIAYYSAYPAADTNDHWYWAALTYPASTGSPSTHDMIFNVNSLETTGYMITIRTEVWGFSFAELHKYRVSLNGTQVGTDQTFFGSGRDTFHLFEVQVPSSLLLSGNNTLRIEALNNGSSSPSHKMLVNWLEVDYRRRYVDENDRLVFTQDTAGTWKYSVSSFAAAPDIFDVTDPYAPVKITGATGTSTVLFERTNSNLATFALSTAAARLSATNITKDTFPNPRLQTTSNHADYLIITDPSFASTLTPLINRRASVDGYTVRTVYVQDIFDEFGYGFYDTEAIRRFLEYTYMNWSAPAPSYVLLVGRGSYDHRNLLGQNGTGGNLVPVYLKSGVDNFLGETAADNQYVEFDNSNGQGVAEMMMGRLPVRTTNELTVVINKILAYETSALAPNYSQHLFVADNGLVYDNTTGQCATDPAGNFYTTIDNFIANHFPIATQYYSLLYYAHSQCVPAPRPAHYAVSVSEVQTRFREMLSQGQHFVVYTGHSGIDFWATNPVLMTTANIDTLVNGNKLPIMLPMTCLEGYHHAPALSGFSETMVRFEGGGAVASYAPTGLQVQTGHDYLLTGFYEGVFEDNMPRVGQAIMNAKLNLAASGNGAIQDLHDTFILLGDPALHMRIWEASDRITLPLLVK